LLNLFDIAVDGCPCVDLEVLAPGLGRSPSDNVFHRPREKFVLGKRLDPFQGPMA